MFIVKFIFHRFLYLSLYLSMETIACFLIGKSNVGRVSYRLDRVENGNDKNVL